MDEMAKKMRDLRTEFHLRRQKGEKQRGTIKDYKKNNKIITNNNAPPISMENSCYHNVRWAKSSNPEVLNTTSVITTGNLAPISR